MNLTHTRNAAAALSVMLVSLALASEAKAQNISGADDKSMSGGSCVPGLQASYGDFDVRASYIQNRATGYRWVACSLVSDSEEAWNTSDSNGGVDNGLAISTVYVRYGSTSGSTQCTWQVIDTLGNVIETGSDSVAGTAGNNYSLTSGSMLLGGGEGRSFGVNCLLPPGARLHHINWEEYGYTTPEVTY